MHVLFVLAFLQVNWKLFASQLKTSRDPIHLDFSAVVFSLIRQVCTFCRSNWYKLPVRPNFLANWNRMSVCTVHQIHDYTGCSDDDAEDENYSDHDDDEDDDGDEDD